MSAGREGVIDYFCCGTRVHRAPGLAISKSRPQPVNPSLTQSSLKIIDHPFAPESECGGERDAKQTFSFLFCERGLLEQGFHSVTVLVGRMKTGSKDCLGM